VRLPACIGGSTTGVCILAAHIEQLLFVFCDFLGPWSGRPPFRKARVELRQWTLFINGFLRLVAKMVVSQYGDMVWKAVLVQFGGLISRARLIILIASCQGKAPHVHKFRAYNASSNKTFLQPPHPPRCILLCTDLDPKEWASP